MVSRLLACIVFAVLSPVFSWADHNPCCVVFVRVPVEDYVPSAQVLSGDLVVSPLVSSLPDPVVRDGVCRVRVETTCPGNMAGFARHFVVGGSSPFSLGDSVTVLYNSSSWASTVGQNVFITSPSIGQYNAPTTAAANAHLGWFTVVLGGVTYRSFFGTLISQSSCIYYDGHNVGFCDLWFVREGYCGWCGKVSTTGTHGNGVCNLPCVFCGNDSTLGSHGDTICNAVACEFCGGNTAICLHGDHTCPPGEGGGGIDDELLAIVYPLLVNLITTIIVLQSVHIGVALATIFLAFFRDFLKSF